MMRQRSRVARKWSVVCGVVLLAGLLSALPAAADHSWKPYHWARTSNPFVLKVGDNVPGVWDPYLDQAIVDWNNSEVLDLEEVAGGTQPTRCRPTAGRIEVCAAKYGLNGWLGLAQIWASGDHITQATAKMNDSYFSGATYNTPAWRHLVMCQEIAHDFGLGHQDETFDNPNLGSCMDYTSNPKGNEHPNQHDYDQLKLIYSHPDSGTTIGAAGGALPGRGPDGDLNTPAEWGRLVADYGGASVYVRELDHGIRIITHVTWAADRNGRGR